MNFILDLLFPKRCLGCGWWGRYLCSSCQKTLTPTSSLICPACTRLAIDGVIHPGCRGRYTLDGLTAAFRYENVVRAFIRKIKYEPWLTDLSQTIIDEVMTLIEREKAFQHFIGSKPVVAVVPLHWSRRLFRGYNHAELLGTKIAQKLGLSFKNVLIRTRRTRPQYGLQKDKREENVASAFALRHEESERAVHHAVLLFDDVWTTGATMRECTNVLKKAGVEKVWALTIAR